MKKLIGFLTKEQAKDKFKGTPNENISNEAINKNYENGYKYIEDNEKRLEPIKTERFYKLIQAHCKQSDMMFLIMFYEDYKCYALKTTLHSATGQNFEYGDIINKNTKEDSFIGKIQKHDYNKKRSARFKKFVESKIYKNHKKALDWTRINALGISFNSIAKKSKNCDKYVKKIVVTEGFSAIIAWYKQYYKF